MSQQLHNVAPLAVGVKTHIGKQACILLNDVVSNRLPASMHDSILISHVDQYFFYCSALAFNQLRAAEPQLPIYGFWQTLHASGFFVEPTPLVVVHTGADEGRFFYRAKDNSVYISGELRQGKPLISKQITLPDFSSAKVCALSDIHLRLPPTPILTLAERNQRQQSLRKHRITKVVAALGCFAASFFSLHHHLADQRAEQQSIYDNLQSQVDQLRQQHAKFVSTKKESWPWQWPALEMIYRLATVDEQLNIWGLDLDKSLFEASMQNSLQLPDSIRADVDEVDYKQDGTMVVRWSQPQ